MRPLRLLDTAAHHGWIALRTVLRNKRAYLPATGILALGIGMSVAMFSLVDAVLLRPLPFPNQESIYVIWKVDRLAGNHVEELAYPELRDLQDNIRTFEYVAVMPTSLYGYAKVLQRNHAEPVQIESAPVSHDFFRVLGVSPRLGRDFVAADEQVGAPPVVVLSDRVWRDELGADPGIVGHLIRLNGQGHLVIGVMARGVEFPRGAGLWVPLGVESRIVERRRATFLQAIARAKPAVGRDSIASDVNTLFQRMAADHPDAYRPSQRAVVTPLVEYWIGSARAHLWIVLGASLLLLVASIVSAGNLMLSRMLGRQAELATRLALGARRAQILVLLGTEGGVIALLAAIAGLAIAQFAIRFLVRLAPADIPRLQTAALNLNSYGVAAGAAAIAALACATFAACGSTHNQLESALREGGVRLSVSRRASWTRNVFILSQATITMVLLMIASLLVLTYRGMIAVNTGFANRDAVSMNLQLRGPAAFSSRGLTPQTRRLFYGQLLDRLRHAPGVTSAAAILLRPLEGTIGWDVSYEFEFEAGRNDRQVLPKTNYEVVTPEYFKTVGTPILEGRDFDDHDTEGAEPVVIISRTLAQRVRAAGFSPLGHRLRHGLNFDHWSTVVGVSADARYRNITQTGSDIFAPSLQAAQPTNYVIIRNTQPAQDLVALTRRALADLDPTQAVAGVATLGELIDANASRYRFNMILLLWFGVCSAVLAATGVYSVIAETLAARRREIAIKIALGASTPRLIREMVAHTLVLVVIGELVGAWLASGLGRLGSGVFYGISPGDPWLLGAVAAFLFLVSLVSALWPAWSASAGNPRLTLQSS